MEQLDVEIKEATLVAPSEPTPTHILQLSALDSQPFLRFTIEYLLVYPPCCDHDRTAIAARLKDGLARALVAYYPLAGRVRPQASSSSSLEVVCQAQGAVFIEAVSNVRVYEFERAPHNPDHRRKFLALHVADVLRGPPLVVQLTWLADGAAAVGVGISHCICDGVGSGEFLNSWSEFVNGRRGLNGPWPKPVWNRHLLDPVQPSTRSVPHPEFERVPDLSRFSTRLARNRLTPTAICFNRGHLAELKKLALRDKWFDSGRLLGRLGESSYTSFEVLAAHVWRCWVRAMGLVDRQIVRLLFSINARKRVEPSLPEGYYGNGFVLGCAQTTVKELREKGLGFAARLVRKAKERVDDDYVRSVVEAVTESRASPDSVGVLILSQWSRLALEKVDIGLGRPVHVGPICSDIYCLFLPVFNEDDAVKVMLAVPMSVVAKYERLLRNPK
ncbi:hypothetical protein AAC387_Pa01g0633 [Persea americana]